ncbi:MAG: hypothetical protein ACSLEL_00845 [Candidatus Malihini olakiniferum]
MKIPLCFYAKAFHPITFPTIFKRYPVVGYISSGLELSNVLGFGLAWDFCSSDPELVASSK